MVGDATADVDLGEGGSLEKFQEKVSREVLPRQC